MNEDVFELRMKGYCCSQIIMELGLRKLGKENPDLIQAAAGLCNGLWQGKTCGIFSAAICLLYLADPEGADRYHAAAFSEWFEDVYGSSVCEVLLDNNSSSKFEKCPSMIEASFLKICDLLEWD